jgi:hypothetical protein
MSKQQKGKPEPTRVEGGAPDDINIIPADPAPWADQPKEGTDLPGCDVCGGIVNHTERCVGYLPENQISAPAGWCAPSEGTYDTSIGKPVDFRLPLPPEMWSPVPTLEEPLDIDQLSRVEALKAARVVLQTSSGIFGGTSTGSHSVDDLIRIARFITTGQYHPQPQ